MKKRKGERLNAILFGPTEFFSASLLSTSRTEWQEAEGIHRLDSRGVETHYCFVRAKIEMQRVVLIAAWKLGLLTRKLDEGGPLPLQAPNDGMQKARMGDKSVYACAVYITVTLRGARR